MMEQLYFIKQIGLLKHNIMTFVESVSCIVKNNPS